MNSSISRRAFTAAIVATSIGLGTKVASAKQDLGTPAPEASPLSMTPAGLQLQWALDVINGVEPAPSDQQLVDHFAVGFLAQVPVSQLSEIFKQLHTQFAPATIAEVVGIPTPLAIDAVIEAAENTRLIVSITVEEQSPNKISGLLFSPYDEATPTIDAIASWEELETSLSAAGPRYAIYAAEITPKGDPVTIHDAKADELLAIGSVFKLYVLGAVATAIDRGKLSWDQQLVVTDEVKSFPSGVTQNEIAGTKLSLEDLAKRMISISDNTAADMLIGAATRDACEVALVTQGNSEPERSMPFLTTKELFTLKLTDDTALRDDFRDADVDGRRALLPKIDAMGLPPIETAAAWAKPIAIDTIEWFATMSDLSTAITWLWDRGAEPGLENVREILTINPGVPFDTSVWKSVAFKGGSEVGVIALCWLLERVDGRTFTFACGVNNDESALQEQTIALAAGGAFSLLAAVK